MSTERKAVLRKHFVIFLDNCTHKNVKSQKTNKVDNEASLNQP